MVKNLENSLPEKIGTDTSTKTLVRRQNFKFQITPDTAIQLIDKTHTYYDTYLEL